MRKDSKKIVLTGKLDSDNWNAKDRNDFCVDDDNLTDALREFDKQKVKITIEVIEE
jgi:hypothetical protein